MEAEKLIMWLRDWLRSVRDEGLIIDCYEPDADRLLGNALDCPIQLNRRRLYATAAKALATDPSMPEGVRLAGALVQMCGCGDAKPYEVCDE